MTDTNLLDALRELHGAAMAWRDAAYDACPALVVRNEQQNRLSATLFAAGKAIAAAEAEARNNQEA